MAGNAGGVQTLEHSHGGVGVAALARNDGMCAHQWEAILMHADGLQRHIPAEHSMTLLAIGAHLPAVYVGVAVGALRADLGKYEVRVAITARDGAVQPAQGISRFAVVEFHVTAQWRPADRRVACLARHFQRAVRVGHLGVLLLLRGTGSAARSQKAQQRKE